MGILLGVKGWRGLTSHCRRHPGRQGTRLRLRETQTVSLSDSVQTDPETEGDTDPETEGTTDPENEGVTDMTLREKQTLQPLEFSH